MAACTPGHWKRRAAGQRGHLAFSPVGDQNGCNSMKEQKRPQVVLAFADQGISKRIMQEPGLAGARAGLVAVAGGQALPELLRKTEPAVDILVTDIASALLLAQEPVTGPLVGVLLDAATDVLPEALVSAGFSALWPGAAPRPHSGVAAWLTGAIAAVNSGRQAEEAACNQRYEDLVHALPDIVYELDINGTISFINQSVSILGYKPAELLGKHYSVLLHDDDAAVVDRDRVLPDFSGYRTGPAFSPKLFNERRGIDRRTTDLEVRLKKKPGFAGAQSELIGTVISYGEVSSVGDYTRDDQREFKGSVGIIRDITMRRKSEDMLRKLYQAVDQLGACVFVLNHVFEIEYVNPVFFMLTGFAPPDVIGQRIFRFFAFLPDKVDRLSRSVQDGFESKEEVLVPRVTGGQFWAAFSMAPVRNPTGAITHAIVIVEDISSRKSMEELLEKTRLEADEQYQSKISVLSRLGDEFREPLDRIVSRARDIQDGSDKAGQMASAILGDSKKLFGFLDVILDYIRSEKPVGPLKKITFSFAPFFERICAPYRNESLARGLQFECVVKDDELIQSDADRLGRALELLLDASLEALSRGKISVAAEIQRQGGNVPHLVITVQKTGTNFTWGELSGREPEKSSSAWFDVCARMIKVLGGELRLVTAPDDSSTYTIIVPVATPVRAHSSVPERFSVLVVDDNVVNLEYMRTLIENHGHRVHVASGAVEAFGILETRYVDAALLDIRMPGMSGVELARAIRGYEGNKYSRDMPLFAMTAQELPELEGDSGLFVHVFSKPTDIARFSLALGASIEARELPPVTGIALKGDKRADVLKSLELEAEAAFLALSLAISGSTGARIDIRAEAVRISAIFKRLSYRAGQEMVALFLEHYSHEEPPVLAALLSRMRGMLDKSLAALRQPGGDT